MSETEVGLGPVDYLIVEWPKGTQPSGEGLSVLGDLVEQGLIRVLDLVFVAKDDEGTVEGLALADLDGDGTLDLMQFEGASSGILGEHDYNEASAALEPGTSAAILLYENRWALPFAAAVRKTGAQVVARGGIPHDALVEALDAAEAAQV